MSEIRPMTLADVPAAAAVTDAADKASHLAEGREPEQASPDELAYFHAGLARFVELDPQGAFAATDGERLLGFANAIRRGPFWGLAMLFVHPDAQSRGVGRRLLEAALPDSEGAEVRMIMTSSDPRALRRYSLAGLDIHPAVQAKGRVDTAAIPSGLPGREGTTGDLALVAAVDEQLRGSRAEDVEWMLGAGMTMQVIDDGAARGYLVHRGKRMRLLGASDEQTATALLWRFFAAAGEAEIWAMTARQDWAVKAALAAGLEVTPSGPMFIGGMPEPPGPWLPSGWYF